MMPLGEAKGSPLKSCWRGSGTEERELALSFLSLASSTPCSSVTGCIVLTKELLKTSLAMSLHIWWTTSGENKVQRCQALGEHMKAYYAANAVEDTLKEFLPKTYAPEKSTRPPRLKGNAATTRALVKFGDQMAQQFSQMEFPMSRPSRQQPITSSTATTACTTGMRP